MAHSNKTYCHNGKPCHQNKIMNRLFVQFQQQHSVCDARIISDNVSLDAHWCVLEANSAYFRNITSCTSISNTNTAMDNNNKKKTFIFPSHLAGSLPTLLHYMYCGSD